MHNVLIFGTYTQIDTFRKLQNTCHAASLPPQISSHPWPSGLPGSEGKKCHFF